MHRFQRLAAIIFASLLWGTFTATQAEERPLLTSAERLLLENASEVTAVLMSETRDISGEPSPSQPASGIKVLSAQQKHLVALVQKSQTIDAQARLSRCNYRPDVKFTFEPESLILHLCFNCDVWALTKEPNAADHSMNQVQSIKFGDIRDARAELVLYVKELFGSDLFVPEKVPMAPSY